MSSAVAAARAVEVLRFRVEAPRATQVLESLLRAAAGAGVHVSPTRAYGGTSPLLVLWGPGAPDRFGPMRLQVAGGGHVIALDLGYWRRHETFRVSIDAPHPQAWIMRRAWPLSRWERDRVTVADAWDPSGPVIVAGIGAKATVQYGAETVRAWEREMVSTARLRGATVWYRPKASGVAPHDVPLAPAGDIDAVLRGASRLITWHSNVAVDAIRMGIPVICRDGAAAAVCPATWNDDQAPLPADLRAQFLGNLAWFQWTPREAAACWRWLLELLP